MVTRKMCATCKHRHGFTDGRGITHCDNYAYPQAYQCIKTGYTLWEQDNEPLEPMYLDCSKEGDK